MHFLIFEIRDHQPFCNCELLLVYRLKRRATSLMHTSTIKSLLNLPPIILVLIFVNVKTLIMLTLFLEQARGHHVGDPRSKYSNSTSQCFFRRYVTISFKQAITEPNEQFFTKPKVGVRSRFLWHALNPPQSESFQKTTFVHLNKTMILIMFPTRKTF